MNDSFPTLFKKAFLVFLFGLIVLGAAFRLYHINRSEFFFYDEGYYLTYNYTGLSMIDSGLTKYPGEVPKMVRAFVRISMMSGKALWFLVADSRVFWGGVNDWFFPRIVAAVAGILSFLIVYCFARRYYDSRWTALLSVALLAILPGHVFYSRLGLQETLCAFFFLLGFYFYIFPKRFGWRTFVSAFFFGLAYFTNYRLMILPLLIAACELYQSFSLKDRPDFRKYLWNTLGFFIIVIGVGSYDNARNLTTILGWLVHQEEIAGGSFDLINFFSYPYYLFRLENFILALVFFGSVIWIFKKDNRSKALPFVIAVCLMAGFSLPPEKAARYMVVVYPFIVMSVAYAFESLIRSAPRPVIRRGIAVILILMMAAMTYKSYRITRINSDYKKATEFLTAKDSNVKFLSTQPYIQSLFTRSRKDVESPSFGFQKLLRLYKQGYRYLVIDPQAFVTWTKEHRSFEPKLEGYMNYVWRAVPPIKVYDHFGPLMLERFVFEHSQNLSRSIRFLRLADQRGFGKIRIYDLNQIIAGAFQALDQSGKYKNIIQDFHD